MSDTHYPACQHLDGPVNPFEAGQRNRWAEPMDGTHGQNKHSFEPGHDPDNTHSRQMHIVIYN